MLSGNINQRRYVVDGFLHEPASFDVDLNRTLGTDGDAVATTQACSTNDRMTIYHINRAYETYVLIACPASDTPIADPNRDARHTRELFANFRCGVGQYFQYATAGTTIADREQLCARADTEPDGI